MENEDCMLGVCPDCPKRFRILFNELKNINEVSFYQREKNRWNRDALNN